MSLSSMVHRRNRAARRSLALAGVSGILAEYGVAAGRNRCCALLFTVAPGKPISNVPGRDEGRARVLEIAAGPDRGIAGGGAFPGNQTKNIRPDARRSLSDWEALQSRRSPVAVRSEGALFEGGGPGSIRANPIAARPVNAFKIPAAFVPQQREHMLAVGAERQRHDLQPPPPATAGRRDAGTARRRATSPSAAARRAGRPRPRRAPARPVRRDAAARSRASARGREMDEAVAPVVRGAVVAPGGDRRRPCLVRAHVVDHLFMRRSQAAAMAIRGRPDSYCGREARGNLQPVPRYCSS